MGIELQRGQGRRTGRGSDEDSQHAGSKGKWCFEAKHVVGVDSSLADLIELCEYSSINAELKRQRTDVDWRKQVLGGEEEEKCSTILRCDMRTDVLRHRLEELTRELGGSR